MCSQERATTITAVNHTTAETNKGSRGVVTPIACPSPTSVVRLSNLLTDVAFAPLFKASYPHTFVWQLEIAADPTAT